MTAFTIMKVSGSLNLTFANRTKTPNKRTQSDQSARYAATLPLSAALFGEV